MMNDKFRRRRKLLPDEKNSEADSYTSASRDSNMDVGFFAEALGGSLAAALGMAVDPRRQSRYQKRNRRFESASAISVSEFGRCFGRKRDRPNFVVTDSSLFQEISWLQGRFLIKHNL
jgi:hypothetical protein